jgi:hypothetical protein
LKEFPTENYGKPVQVAYYATWETFETKIILSLQRLSNKVILNDQYISKEFISKQETD